MDQARLRKIGIIKIHITDTFLKHVIQKRSLWNSFIHLSRCEVGRNPTKTVLKSNNKKLYNSAITHNTFMNCKDWSKSDLKLENGSLPLPSNVHANSYPLPGVCVIWKRFYGKRKASDVLNKMRYILWVVVLLEKCHVNNNGRHLGRHLGFYQGLEIRLKPREKLLVHDFSLKIYFYC